MANPPKVPHGATWRVAEGEPPKGNLWQGGTTRKFITLSNSPSLRWSARRR